MKILIKFSDFFTLILIYHKIDLPTQKSDILKKSFYLQKPPSQEDDVLPGISSGLALKFSALRNALDFFFNFCSLRKNFHLWVSALRKTAPRNKDGPRLQKKPRQ